MRPRYLYVSGGEGEGSNNVPYIDFNNSVMLCIQTLN